MDLSGGDETDEGTKSEVDPDLRFKLKDLKSDDQVDLTAQNFSVLREYLRVTKGTKGPTPDFWYD